jgi:hypothetical protein
MWKSSEWAGEKFVLFFFGSIAGKPGKFIGDLIAIISWRVRCPIVLETIDFFPMKAKVKRTILIVHMNHRFQTIDSLSLIVEYYHAPSIHFIAFYQKAKILPIVLFLFEWLPFDFRCFVIWSFVFLVSQLFSFFFATLRTILNVQDILI